MVVAIGAHRQKVVRRVVFVAIVLALSATTQIRVQAQKPAALAKAERDAFAGNELMRNGKYAEAIELLQTVLPVARRYGDVGAPIVGQASLDIGWSKKRLYEISPTADLATQLEREAEVERWIEDAYAWALRDRNVNRQVTKSADFARILGDHLQDCGRLEPAIRWYALCAQREAERPERHAARYGVAHVRLGEALLRGYRRGEAATAFETAVESLRPLPPNRSYLDALAGLGQAWFELGRIDSAGEVLARWSGVRGPGLLTAELVVPPPEGGVAGSYGGLRQEALAMLEVGALVCRARIAIEFDDPLRAEAELAQLEDLDLGFGVGVQGRIDLVLAECLEALGRRNEALELRWRACDLARWSGDDVELGHHLAGLASAHLRLGERERAIALVDECLDQLAADAPPSVRRSELYGALADSLAELGQLDRALELASERLGIARALEDADPQVELQPMIALSEVHALRGEAADALALAADAADLADKHELGTAWRYRVAYALRTLEADTPGAEKDAIRLLCEAVSSLEAARDSAALLEGRDRGRYLAELRDPDPYAILAATYRRLGEHVRAAQVIEEGRARGALEFLATDYEALLPRRRRSTEETHVAFEHITATIRSLTAEIGVRELELARSGDGAEGTTARMRLDRVVDDYRRAARARAKLVVNRARQEHPEPARLTGLSSLLGRGSALLLYELDEFECSVAFVTKNDSETRILPLLTSENRPIERSDLEGRICELVLALRSHGSGQGPTRGTLRGGAPRMRVEPSRTRELAEKLFGTLVPEELWKRVHDLERLYIVTDGALHYLPFETLIVPASKEQGDVSAVERYWLDVGPPILYGPSASVLELCRVRALPVRRATKRLDVLAVGDPRYGEGTDGFERYPRLPGTIREIEQAYRAWTGKTFDPDYHDRDFVALFGADATEARLFEHAEHARILHFATHHLADESPWATRSRLLLAEPDEVVPGDDGSLSMLDLHERWRGRLQGSELVILSACATGLGDDLGAEGLLATPIGFLGAGAPAVVSTLWPVEDAPASELMVEFHQVLRGERASPLAALVAARKRLKVRYPNPSHWGAFVLVGYSR